MNRLLAELAAGVAFTALPTLSLAGVVALTQACSSELERRTAERDEAKIAGLVRATWAPEPARAQ